MTPFLRVDLQGHCVAPAPSRRFISDLESWSSLRSGLDRANELMRLPLSLVPGLAQLALAGIRYVCPNCSTQVTFHRDGSTAVADTACAYPQGMPAFTVELDVPSGVMVWANDFRSVVALDGIEDEFDVNRLSGLRDCTQAYAAEGMVHIFVGSTSPSVRRHADGRLSVGEDPDGESLGSICTDLWWVSAMDETDYLARCQALGQSPDKDLIRVSVVPGRWSFTVDYMVRYRPQGEDEETTYTTGVRTGPCQIKPRVRPYAVETSLVDSHFLAKLTHTMTHYTLSGAEFLTDVFCTLGTGYRWRQGRISGDGPADSPYFPSLQDSAIRANEATKYASRIPSAALESVLSVASVYPMSQDHDLPLAAQAPAQANGYWLAAALVCFQSLSLHPRVLMSEAGYPDQTLVVARTLDALCTQVSDEGRWAEMEDLFAQMTATGLLAQFGARPAEQANV